MTPTTMMLDALRTYANHPLARRFDSWVNDVTGFGTDRDKSTYGTVAPSARMSDLLLSALYHTDDMAARMVDIVPQEMLREGFGASVGDVGLDADLKKGLDDLGVRSFATEGLRWGRCYGGAAILLGCDDGREATKPLRPEYAEDLSYLMVLDRRMIWPLDYYTDPTNRKFGRPRRYMIWMSGGPASTSAVVHESRLVLFPGATTGIQERNQNMGWDLSVLQRPFEILRQFNSGWKATELMLTDANQGIFKMSGLAQMIQSKGMDLLQMRLRLTDMYRSVVRAMVVDAESGEAFERTSTSFEGIPDTLEKLMLRLAAAVQIPVTILMGQSPAGMNATGESDFRWFYDRLRSEQTIVLEPRLRQIIDVLLQTRRWRRRFAGRDLTITFPKLWTETPAAEAQRRLTVAQADAAYVQAQILTPEEVALSRVTPNGFGDELVMSDEARAARERVLSEDLASMKGGAPEEDEGETQDLRTDGDDEFKESEHPRDKDGKFGSGSGSSPSKDKGGKDAKGGAKASDPKRAAAIRHAAKVVRSTATNTNPSEFHASFTDAMKGNPFSAFVSHYSKDELAGMKALVTAADGKVGIAVKDHGDGRIEGTALFNKGGPPRSGTELLKYAVRKHGVNYVECFGENLRGFYEGAGFKVESTSDFDEEYAPKDWDYSTHGRPKYYTMRIKERRRGEEG